MFFILNPLRDSLSLSPSLFLFSFHLTHESIFQSLSISSSAYIAIKLELAIAKRSANDIIQNLARTLLKLLVRLKTRIVYHLIRIILEKMHRFERYCCRHGTARAGGSVKISTHK